MNKNRMHHRPVQAVRMCNTHVKTSQCQFGGECKFSHDLAASFAARDPDLGEKCPLYTLNGFCRFGVTCRFGCPPARPPYRPARLPARLLVRPTDPPSYPFTASLLHTPHEPRCMLPPRATRSAHLREDGANVYADGAELRDGIPTDLNVVKMELTQAPHVHVHACMHGPVLQRAELRTDS